MTNLISIFLSSLILLQGFGLHVSDIVQLDELIEHYQFHSEEHGDNFLVFVSKHYGEQKATHEQENQNEKKEHEQLPFQNHSHFSFITIFFLDTTNAEWNSPDLCDYRSLDFYYRLASSSHYSDGPFQPPQLS